MGSLFWASFFILLGLSIVFKALFHIDIPVAKIFVAVFFVYLGVSMLLGPTFFFKSKTKVHRTHGTSEYVVVFSKQFIDFSSLTEEDKEEIETVVVFGNSTIKINPEIPTKITFQGAFAGINIPDSDEQLSLMGKTIYTTPNFDKNKKYLKLNITAVFASIKVIS